MSQVENRLALKGGANVTQLETLIVRYESTAKLAQNFSKYNNPKEYTRLIDLQATLEKEIAKEVCKLYHEGEFVHEI